MTPTLESDIIELKIKELIGNETKILEKVYKYDNQFVLKDSEVKALAKAFEDPNILILLRKALSIYSLKEVGFVYDVVAEREIDFLVEQRIKTGLISFYTAIQTEEKRKITEQIGSDLSALYLEKDKALQSEASTIKANKKSEDKLKEEKAQFGQDR